MGMWQLMVDLAAVTVRLQRLKSPEKKARQNVELQP